MALKVQCVTLMIMNVARKLKHLNAGVSQLSILSLHVVRDGDILLGLGNCMSSKDITVEPF